MRPGARLVLAVAAGGALGSALRHAASLAAVALLGSAFPWGTLAVNVAGSWLVGLLLGLGRADKGDPMLRAFLLPGFCGGFTTFSLFSLETVMLAGESLPRAGLYAGLSLLLCLVGVFLGHEAALRVRRPSRSG